MPEISLNRKDGTLKVSYYDGSSSKGTITARLNQLSDRFVNQEWQFFREGSNHTYTKGNAVHHNGQCSNNLLVSSYGNVRLTDIRNAFIFINGPNIELRPIDMPLEATYRGLTVLDSQRIRYNIPKSVSERENLKVKDERKLTGEIQLNYGFVPENISLVPSKSKIGGIYLFSTKDGKKYIFKYRNKDREGAENRSIVVSSMPDLFPPIYSRLDGSGYTSELEDGWYGLEDFVGGSIGTRNLDYFTPLGKHVAFLHKRFKDFQERHGNLVEKHSGGHLGEASFAAFYIDLATSSKNHYFALSELEKIIASGFSERILCLPNHLIHGDLNQSNILWVGGNPRIIDSESIGAAPRINEFIPPLIIKGNRAKPEYLTGSLSELTQAYNRQTKEKLSAEEIRLLIPLLKYSLIRYYVTRNIRRGTNVVDPCELNNTLIAMKDG